MRESDLIRDLDMRGRISEVVVTTMSRSGKPNAAPMGIIRENNSLFVRIYESETLRNVKELSLLAANITDDPLIFVASALGRIEESNFCYFERFPVIKNADAWVIFRCSVAEQRKNSSVFHLKAEASRINSRKVKVINRGLNSVIEAAILATRYVISEDTSRRKEIRKMIDHHNVIVEKCGGERERMAMDMLYTKLGLTKPKGPSVVVDIP